MAAAALRGAAAGLAAGHLGAGPAAGRLGAARGRAAAKRGYGGPVDAARAVARVVAIEPRPYAPYDYDLLPGRELGLASLLPWGL